MAHSDINAVRTVADREGIVKKNVWEAAKLYMKAYRCIKKAEELLEAENIKACNLIEAPYEEKYEPEVQIYSGIKGMEDMEHNLADRPPLWKGDEPRENCAWLKICGVNFFQFKSHLGYTLK